MSFKYHPPPSKPQSLPQNEEFIPSSPPNLVFLSLVRRYTIQTDYTIVQLRMYTVSLQLNVIMWLFCLTSSIPDNIASSLSLFLLAVIILANFPNKGSTLIKYYVTTTIAIIFWIFTTPCRKTEKGFVIIFSSSTVSYEVRTTYRTTSHNRISFHYTIIQLVWFCALR